MIGGIDFIILAVRDLDAQLAQLEKSYGMPASERSEPAGAGFKHAYFRFSDSFVEVVEPTDPNGPIGRRVAASGDGVYLVALKVDDLEQTVEELRAKGVRLIGDPGPEKPIRGSIFIHPSAASGVLTQLVQR